MNPILRNMIALLEHIQPFDLSDGSFMYNCLAVYSNALLSVKDKIDNALAALVPNPSNPAALDLYERLFEIPNRSLLDYHKRLELLSFMKSNQTPPFSVPSITNTLKGYGLYVTLNEIPTQMIVNVTINDNIDNLSESEISQILRKVFPAHLTISIESS